MFGLGWYKILTVFKHSISAIHGDLVVSFVSVFDAEIVDVEVAVDVWEDEFLFDDFPDDSSHLVTLDLDDRAGFDFVLHDLRS